MFNSLIKELKTREELNMFNKKSLIALGMSAVFFVSAASGCSSSKKESILDPDNPTTVTIWNYYNGDQLTAFEELVKEFNNTIGSEEGIIVESVSQGSIDNLASALIDAVEGKVGADDIPSMASVYAETAYILNKSDAIVSMDSYFTDDELAEYIPSFINEGKLIEEGKLLLFPVSKSTEAFVVNTTDWAAFEEAKGISVDSIKNYEDLAAAAKEYYEWTDSLTPDVLNDGKALYGRDSVANYVYIGTAQLGHEMFTVEEDGKVSVDIDKDTFRTLWDNYYVPFINGYFGTYASYCSEDIKTGSILAMTGSTSGMSYIPTVVTDADDVSHDIEISVSKSLTFKNAVKDVAVQQGAGYCIMKTSEAEQYASAEFLKWFTDTEQNLQFSISSGYSPVKIEANNSEKIKEAFTVDSNKSQNMLNALLVSSDVYTTGDTYTSRAFDGSKDMRDLLSDVLKNTAINDRASIVEKIAAGTSRDEALAEYLSDEYFDKWFDDLCNQVNAIVNK